MKKEVFSSDGASPKGQLGSIILPEAQGTIGAMAQRSDVVPQKIMLQLFEFPYHPRQRFSVIRTNQRVTLGENILVEGSTKQGCNTYNPFPPN